MLVTLAEVARAKVEELVADDVEAAGGGTGGNRARGLLAYVRGGQQEGGGASGGAEILYKWQDCSHGGIDFSLLQPGAVIEVSARDGGSKRLGAWLMKLSSKVEEMTNGQLWKAILAGSDNAKIVDFIKRADSGPSPRTVPLL